MPYQVAVAGSTTHTLQCVEALLADGRFAISWILTPSPKPTGRKQLITPNPLHQFGEHHHLPVILVEHKIDQKLLQQLPVARPDFLLVVDFGYLIPETLLQLPKLAPVNVHPSDLPRWRGSSPGQFVLLYGEPNSKVTIIVMDAGMDTGPILFQQPLSVNPDWTQTEYYFQSFQSISSVLGNTLADLAEQKIQPQPQPADSPTPPARRLTKEDGFVPWSALQAACQDQAVTSTAMSSPLLQEASQTVQSWPKLIEQATRALSPWPLLWTIVPTAKGEKRMQILKSHIKNDTLILDEVKIEGQQETSWTTAQSQLM